MEKDSKNATATPPTATFLHGALYLIIAENLCDANHKKWPFFEEDVREKRNDKGASIYIPGTFGVTFFIGKRFDRDFDTG